MKKTIAASLIPLSTLLVFVLIFHERIALPAWLQVAGRMHPLLMHFPIVLLLLYVALQWIDLNKRVVSAELRDWVLLLGACSALITALMGFFLSKEEGYDEEALKWHKWSGVLFAIATASWYWLRGWLNRYRVSLFACSFCVAGLLIFAGHQGAGITHGQNFLLAPILPEKQVPQVPIEEAELFAHLVKPVLESKCIGCHNSKKAKGELVMETEAMLQKGGKNGKLWDSADANYGLLLKRIHLPAEHKKHMPPQGKPPLSQDEMDILNYWIRSGAMFNKKIIELGTGDTLRLIGEKVFAGRYVASYDFDAADEKTIRKLNNGNRVVYPLAIESPALAASFYNAAFYSAEALRELLAVKNQLVELDMARMPVKDEDLTIISQFNQLQKLNLNATTITGASISELKKLKHLKRLSLAGTAINKEAAEKLEELPQLQQVVIWNTALTSDELEIFKMKKGKLHYETGFRSDTMIMKLTPPIIQNEEVVITGPVPLKLKHYINGAVVRYTLDESDPDSLKSPIYVDTVIIRNKTLVKTKAFKAGWMSSDVVKQYFFKSTYKPDSVRLILPPDQKYKADGPNSLFDLVKSDLNQLSAKWLGYRVNNMEVLMVYNEPITASNVSLSILKAIGSYVMPPASVEVWGGNQPGQLRLLSRIQPIQPKKYEDGEIIPVDVNFKPTILRYIKVIAVPVAKLPAWHQGKGEKGWIFVDEMMVN